MILTGVGISVASGLKTYREKTSDSELSGSNLSPIDRLKDNPLLIWQLFIPLKKACLAAKS